MGAPRKPTSRTNRPETRSPRCSASTDRGGGARALLPISLGALGLDFRFREKPSAPAQGGRRLRGGRIQTRSAFVRGNWRSAVGSAALSMNPIQSFHCKLRGLVTMLDRETPRLLRVLDGEDCDFESGCELKAGTQGRNRSRAMEECCLLFGTPWFDQLPFLYCILPMPTCLRIALLTVGRAYYIL